MIKARPYLAILAATIALSPASLRAEDNPHPTAKALIAVLQSHAPTFDKARACQQLTALGDKEAVPALAALLADEKLASHARSALESIADTSASAALARGREPGPRETSGRSGQLAGSAPRRRGRAGAEEAGRRSCFRRVQRSD